MKKIFICALAAGMFTACSQDETINQQSPMQISFEGAFVENASRAATAADPSTTTESIEGFDVWGYMDNQTGRIFGQGDDGEDVTGKKGNFTYNNTQYWYAGHKFYFSALAPLNSANAVVTPPANGEDVLGLKVNFTNANGTEDLLYAKYTRDIATNADLAQNSGPVEFTFSHLLSKVKFSFKNAYTNPNIHFTVYDIQMTAPKKADINLNNADWEANSTWTLDAAKETTNLVFGTTDDIVQGGVQECANERLTIPATAEQAYTVTFKVNLYNGDVLVNTKPYNHDITLKGVAFEIGKAYDIYAELNADNIIDPDDKDNPDSNSYPIVFDVQEVEVWDQASDAKGEDYTVEKGEEYMLATDITVVGSLKLNSGILNGTGNTVYAEAEPTNNGLVRPSGESTIKDVTLNGKNKSTATGAGIRGIYITAGGTYNIDNVTVEDVAYAINVNTTAAVTLNVSNSTLEGWTSYGSTTTATFTKVNFTVGDFYGTDNQNYSKNDNGLFRPYGTTTLTDCSFAKDFWIDVQELAKNGKKITFNNCTYNGTVITQENIETLGFIDNYNAEAIAW
ncbi:MAG: fimbrillin family protein [Bacteroides sp.]|nr:fimbrillin family protein [Bacteroides sp.]